MKRIILSLWGIATTLFCVAQTPQDYIKGQVVDQNNNPLFGANLVWEGTTIGVISDEEGLFQIDAPNSYPRKLVVSYVGYESKVVKVDKLKQYRIALNVSVQLDGVDVNSKINSTSISLINPIQVENISSCELEKAACCNLAESFETNATVDVNYSDAITGARKIQMLGLDGVYTQITQENLPLIRGLSSAYGLKYTPGSWINKIQLSKGVGSVVNGFSSITGQIDLELYKPQTALPLFLNGFASSEGKFEKNIIFSEKKEDWISATLLHASTSSVTHDKNNDGFRDQPTGYLFSALNRWNYVGNDDFYVSFGLKATMEDKLAGSFNSDDFQVKLKNNIVEFFSSTGWLRLSVPGKSMALQTNFSWHDFNSVFNLKNYDAMQNSAYINYIYQSFINSRDHVYKTGFSFYADKFDKQGVILDTTFIDVIGGAYLEYSYLGNQKYTVVAGLRTDYHDVYGTFFTPRLNLKWNPRSDMVVRISGGRGFRTSHPIVENIGALASNRDISIASNLMPEEANNFGGNISKTFYLFTKEGSINLDAYYTLFENQVIVNRETQGTLSFDNLEGNSNSKVLQMDISYNLAEGLDFKGSFKMQEVVATFDGEEKFVPFVPKARCLLNLAYQTPFEDWKFDLTLQNIGSSRIPYHNLLVDNSQLTNEGGEYWSQPFQKLNTQITHVLNNFELYVGGENLLDYIQESPILDSPESENFDASLIWAPTMGRFFYLGFRYKFKK